MNWRARFGLWLLVLSAPVAAGSASARTWHVPADVKTIGAAIDSCWSHPDDNIIVACGYYHESEIRFGQTPVDLRSETGDPDCVTVDAQGAGSVLIFMDTPEGTTVEGFTFTGGNAEFGGGANLCCSRPTFRNCVFEGNEASSGGAINAWKMSAPTFLHCEFVGNTATRGGGGAVASSSAGSPEFRDCVFRANSAPTGAVVMGGLVSSETSMTRCTLWNNSATAPAGASIELVPNANLIMDNCIVAFNSAGAAVHCLEQRSELSLSCNDIFGNPGGDWTGCIAEMLGSDGNFSADPLFCHDQHPEEPLYLAADSPCAPENNPDCGGVGALPVGCTVTGVDVSSPAARAATRMQVYPNPFNPQTSLTFTLSTSRWATVAVYELTGGCVAVLADRIFPAGPHTLAWNGRDSRGRALASGTYVIHLQTESDVQVMKTVLIR